METVSVVSNLLEANCDDEFKKTFQKQKLKFVLLYIISTVVIILLCVNTILLKENQTEEQLNISDKSLYSVEVLEFYSISPKMSICR